MFPESFSKPPRREGSRRLARGISNGEPRADRDAPLVLDATAGARYPRLSPGQPLTAS
jgi:hypothetical protein